MLKIVSGGQTGVDRAALDAALQLGLPCGGWCPKGRRAEDGPIPASYPLKETDSADYAERTALNVRDSDATLILAKAPLAGGTQLTLKTARRLHKPCLVFDPEKPGSLEKARAWLENGGFSVLNVAGPRDPEGYPAARAFLLALLS